MLLQRLSDYFDQIPGTPTLYTMKPIPYVIDLDSEGHLLNSEPIRTVGDGTKRGTDRGKLLLVPDVKRTVGIRPLLFADGADYTFGRGSPQEVVEKAGKDYGKYLVRTAQAHAAYLGIVDRCATSGDPVVGAVCRFLHDDPAAQLSFPEGYDWDGFVTFRVDGAFVVDQPAVRSFWAAEHAPKTEGEGAAHVMQCIVCGQQRPVLTRLQGNIKGLPNGQMSGTALISANSDVFESYGLKNSLIAPICATCAERFTNALNHLLADPEHSVRVGDAAFVFWTREPVAWSAHSFFAPEAAAIRQMLTSPYRKRFDDPEDVTPFYAAALTANNARAVVRDWLDTTVGEMRERIRRWFAAQEIVGRDGDEGEPLGIYALAAATVRDARKELPKETPRLLAHAAFTGQAVPEGLLAQAVRRNRAEGRVTRPRAALIKLALTRRGTIREGEMMTLVFDHPDSAYHCGRLLAVLEQIQLAAIPGIKATVRDRFFGSASTTPFAVFSRLVRGAQPHLSKLQRDRPRAYGALQKRIEGVMDSINGLAGFPHHLTLDQQGLFALGYYQQRAHDRAEATAARARNEQTLLTDEDLDGTDETE